MPSIEQSYRDRQAKAEQLRDACDEFTPTFAPADTSLTVAAFTTFLGTVNAANDNVETLKSNYKTGSETRVTLVDTIKKRVTQVLGYLNSNKAWKSQYASAKQTADKLRGKYTPKKTVAEGEEPPKERNKGTQAYVEIASHLAKIIGICTGTPGYSPSGADITLATLNGFLSQLHGLNTFLNDLDSQVTLAQRERLALYNAEDEGLADKFQSIKEAVKGQYGQSSAQYGTVKGMKW